MLQSSAYRDIECIYGEYSWSWRMTMGQIAFVEGCASRNLSPAFRSVLGNCELRVALLCSGSELLKFSVAQRQKGNPAHVNRLGHFKATALTDRKLDRSALCQMSENICYLASIRNRWPIFSHFNLGLFSFVFLVSFVSKYVWIFKCFKFSWHNSFDILIHIVRRFFFYNKFAFFIFIFIF